MNLKNFYFLSFLKRPTHMFWSALIYININKSKGKKVTNSMWARHQLYYQHMARLVSLTSSLPLLRSSLKQIQQLYHFNCKHFHHWDVRVFTTETRIFIFLCGKKPEPQVRCKGMPYALFPELWLISEIKKNIIKMVIFIDDNDGDTQVLTKIVAKKNIYVFRKHLGSIYQHVKCV